MKKIFSNRIISVASSVLVSTMAVSLVGYAASTISTSITTDGTLRVTGTFTAKGTADFDSTSATTTISGGLRADTADNTLVVDFSSSRVGIGTTSPSVLFSVGGTSILGGPVTMFGPSTAMGAFTIGNLVSTSTAATSTMEWGFAIETNGLLYAADTNRVGIGTTSPGSALSVAGSSQVTGTSTTNALHATSTVFVGATGNLFLVNAAGSVGVATTSPGNLFSVSGSSLLGSADADIVSLRAGDIELNSNATTTIATKNQRGINFSTTTSTGGIVFDTLNSRLYVGSTTPSGGATLGLYSSGTTTLSIGNTVPQATNSEGGCIEMKAIGGSTVHLAATTTPVNGSVAVWMLGGCVVGNGN